MRACSGPGASGFLLALPVNRRLTIGDQSFTMAIRHRLGLRAHSPVDIPACNCSGDNVGKPDHPMTCNACNKCITLRHDSLNLNLRHVHSAAGTCSSIEPPFGKLHRVGEKDKVGEHRADLITLLPGGRHVMVDVTVVHPLGVKALPSASHTNGATAKAAEQDKVEKWRAFADGAQYEFVPFALESYGRLGARAAAYIRELGDIASASGRISKSRFVMNAYKTISCDLQKWNAAIYWQSLTAVTRATGKHFTPGFEAPVEDL